MKHLKKYHRGKLSQISFPLGGIGSGCIGVSGDGRLVDWEIFNAPAKGSRNGHSHFAVRVFCSGRITDSRVINGEAEPPYTGSFVGNGCSILRSFGFGIPAETMPGFPHFRFCDFLGEFPFAELNFHDPDFPGRVKMTAFNPFIPLNEDDSSIPGAFFELEFENTSSVELTYEGAFCLRNPKRHSRNRLITRKKVQMICLEEAVENADICQCGELSVTVSGGDRCFFCENIRQEEWQGDIETYWRDFAAGKEIRPNPSPPGHFDYAVVSSRVAIAPGTKRRIRFLLTWNYPYNRNHWDTPENVVNGEVELQRSWKNYYAVLWKDSCESAVYALRNWDRLQRESMTFKNAFLSASVPRVVLEAASANLSILKSPTVLRLEDGSFWGWEGVHADQGFCYGTCQHVWGYAYALPYLFPKLQRSIHTLSYRWNVTGEGGLIFRLMLPVGAKRKQYFRPAADGQFMEIIGVYREWKLSGDRKWLSSVWPQVKRTIEYAWSPKNRDRWDPEKLGVLTGRQHHTLDMELFGANSWLSSLYITALEAGARMAETMGENADAGEYRRIAARGRKYLYERLFNGGWFVQEIDLHNPAILTNYQESPDDADYKGGIFKRYWVEPFHEIRAQFGNGCMIDQCLGEWHANLCGLPPVFEKQQLESALRSIYQWNYIREMRKFVNTGRVFALNGEAGVVICSWPNDEQSPAIPILYHSECMYGFEYAYAALLIQSGMIQEGVEITRRVRERFDGKSRNPWNEFEAGSNYARSMSSYSLLNAFSGFQFDASVSRMEFSPRTGNDFCAFWSVDSAWGIVRRKKKKIILSVLAGKLKLKKFLYHQILLYSGRTRTVTAGNVVVFSLPSGINVKK